MLLFLTALSTSSEGVDNLNIELYLRRQKKIIQMTNNAELKISSRHALTFLVSNLWTQRKSYELFSMLDWIF